MFVPVLLINMILLVITVLLIIADLLLVNYGECKVTIHEEDEAKEFTVEGGGFLLSSLTEPAIAINSSCAGKASCGYCKVKLLSGGGQILPTEDIFMSREEKLSGMRLACQVKIKEDLEIDIPDFLTTVRTIVKNKTYDPKLRWHLIKTGREGVLPEKRVTRLGKDEEQKLYAILDDFKETPGAVVPVLQRINETFNYLSEPALRFTAKSLHMPLSEVHRLATFYNAFSLQPRGRHIAKVCLGTACYVKGGEKILHSVMSKLGLTDGNTTEDLRYTVETVSCIGCCGQSPVMSVNGSIYGYLKPSMVDGILKRYS